MRTIIVTPTYNERENLNEFVARVCQATPDAHILIVDDSSPDGTGQLAEELSVTRPGKLSVLHRKATLGLGRAYVDGFQCALRAGFDIIIQMDADLSHDPAYIPAMLARIQDCDVVLGSRYVNGIAVVNWDFKRLLLSKFATRYVRMICGMPLTDATGGFKCWRREALEAIQLDKIFSNGYLFQIEMNYRAYRKGMRIAELPVIFYERNMGHSKMSRRIVAEAVFGVLKLRLRV